ncbi:MAG: hypothetical protein WD825_07910 [Gemmatimonadaceae bacterium]
MLVGPIAVLLQIGAVIPPDSARAERATPAPPAKAARAARAARAAQARFETIRRAHLPRNPNGGSYGPCDAQVGRYCYWYDSTQTVVVPEPRRIDDARAELLRFLDSAATSNPSDGWVAGQRVRYLIEGGRPMDAVAAARECRAERWFCAALEGLSFHVAERYPLSDSVFAMALREMPSPRMCEWLDLRQLVDSRIARELGRADCEQRAMLADRLWTLGQPLWSVSGNDLRTEHFARQTMALVLANSANAHGMSWSSDSRELLLRYGWAEWFTRDETVAGLYQGPRVTGHDREPSYHFFPAMESLRGSSWLTTGSWTLREPTARSRYAPRHVKGMSALPHQLARFPRGDSMLVAVAYRIADTAMARDSIAAGLALYYQEKVQIPRVARNDNVMVASLPRDTAIVSIEARGAQSKRAARARYSIGPLPCGTTWCVSDLLFYRPDSAVGPVSMERALRTAATELRFSNREQLGVFWETQGPDSALASMSLTVTPIRVSLARRVATRLKLAPDLAPVRLRWQTLLSAHAQHVTLHFPASARGTYRVTLMIGPRGAPPMVATREIEVQ